MGIVRNMFSIGSSINSNDARNRMHSCIRLLYCIGSRYSEAIHIMHEKDRSYNGWSNYETWNFKLWLDNDEFSYKRTQELVKASNKDAGELASNLRDLAMDEAPEIQASFYSDVMMASVREVNYYEVAQSLLEE